MSEAKGTGRDLRSLAQDWLAKNGLMCHGWMLADLTKLLESVAPSPAPPAEAPLASTKNPYRHEGGLSDCPENCRACKWNRENKINKAPSPSAPQKVPVAETAVGVTRNGGCEGDEDARSVKPETPSPAPDSSPSAPAPRCINHAPGYCPPDCMAAPQSADFQPGGKHYRQNYVSQGAPEPSGTHICYREDCSNQSMPGKDYCEKCVWPCCKELRCVCPPPRGTDTAKLAEKLADRIYNRDFPLKAQLQLAIRAILEAAGVK